MDEFVNIKLNLNNLWSFQIRTNIFNAIKTETKNFEGTLLDVGCGSMPYKNYIIDNSKIRQYIGLDIENPYYVNKIKPDIFWDGKKMPIEDNTIDHVLLSEVLEHSPTPENLISEIYRVLKPDGTLFLTVPFIWHLHETPYDECRYTPYALKRILSSQSFKSIDISALGGWDSSLSQILGLWVTFRPLNRLKKSMLLRVIYLLIKVLNKRDKKPTLFSDKLSDSMISGLYAICKK